MAANSGASLPHTTVGSPTLSGTYNIEGRREFVTSQSGEVAVDNDEDPMVICCAGPPLCMLQGDEAVAAQQAGCELCKRIIVHSDGTETIVERQIH